MSKKYLKVDVSKELLSEVYLCVDADSVKAATPKIPGVAANRILISPILRDLAQQAALELSSHHWEEDELVSVLHATEVTQEEAEQYGVFHSDTAPPS